MRKVNYFNFFRVVQTIYSWVSWKFVSTNFFKLQVFPLKRGLWICFRHFFCWKPRKRQAWCQRHDNLFFETRQRQQMKSCHQQSPTRILTSKENIHVADNLIVDDDEESKGQERCVLKNNVQRNSCWMTPWTMASSINQPPTCPKCQWNSNSPSNKCSIWNDAKRRTNEKA